MPREKDVKRVVRKRMAETGERYTDARAAIQPGAQRQRAGTRRRHRDTAEQPLVEVEFHEGIRLHLGTGQHFVVLKERGSERRLSFAIGSSEANAIAVVLTGMTVPRPMSPDLMVSSIRALGGEVERVVITRVDEQGTFYAEVHVGRGQSRLAPIDARPSDALGVAVRTGAPIFVAARVMEAAGGSLDSVPEGVTADEIPLLRGDESFVTTAAYRPIVPPTHMLIDAGTERLVTLLGIPPAAEGEPNPEPQVGKQLKLRATEGWRAYRIVAVEPGSDGLTRLRAELMDPPEAAAAEGPTSGG